MSSVLINWVLTMKRLKPYVTREDPRGRLIGLLNEGNWEEFNYLETAAGNSRGGHYHEHTLEVFFILAGEIDVELSAPDSPPIIERVSTGDVFMIEPGETHTFHCRTDTSWINVLSSRFDPANPDMHIPSSLAKQP